MATTETRTVRYVPQWAEDGKPRTEAVEVTARTTANQVLRRLGLDGRVLLPAGCCPAMPGAIHVLEVQLDPENVALAGADFVVITPAEAQDLGRLLARFAARCGRP